MLTLDSVKGFVFLFLLFTSLEKGWKLQHAQVNTRCAIREMTERRFPVKMKMDVLRDVCRPL